MQGYVPTVATARWVTVGLAAALSAGTLAIGTWQLTGTSSPSQVARVPTTAAPSTTAALSTTTETTTVPATPTSTIADPGPSMVAAVDAVWARVPSGCVSVTEGDRVVYEVNPVTPSSPASVIKVLTAIVALDALGPDRRLKTSVRADPPVDGVVAGDLFLVGGGDPVLGTEAWARATAATIHTSLDALADRVAATGIRTIEGKVVGDESRYDQARTVDSWPRRLVADGEAGPLSALLVNDGFQVLGHPGTPFANPAAGAAELFTELLRARGIEVRGEAGSGVAPDVAPIASIDSAPLHDIVAAMLRDSDNETAELLFKELGLLGREGGSTASGEAFVRRHLLAIGLPVDGSRMADGSGLSDENRLTCRLLTAALSARGPAIADGLAVAGRTGTLRSRLRGTELAGRLHAKTGSLDGVSGLAGYYDADGGRRLTFALLVNGLPITDSGQSVQDQFALALAQTQT